jgi:hypothetical protein
VLLDQAGILGRANIQQCGRRLQFRHLGSLMQALIGYSLITCLQQAAMLITSPNTICLAHVGKILMRKQNRGSPGFSDPEIRRRQLEYRLQRGWGGVQMSI